MHNFPPKIGKYLSSHSEQESASFPEPHWSQCSIGLPLHSIWASEKLKQINKDSNIKRLGLIALNEIR